MGMHLKNRIAQRSLSDLGLEVHASRKPQSFESIITQMKHQARYYGSVGISFRSVK